MSTKARIAVACAAILVPSVGQAVLDEKLALRESQSAIGRQLGDYRLRDSGEREVRLSSFRGKPLVVSFVYTGCFQVCPTATRALGNAVQDAEKILGPGTFNIATIGFNLPFDTPQAMKEFQSKHGNGNANWKFLSPEAESLAALVADFGFRFEQTSAGFDHMLQASIVDAQGKIYRQLYGDSFNGPQFVGPLLELARNAPRPAGEIAGLVEQIRLLCTVYDPASGRYRVNYAVLIEILVGASVLLVGIVSVTVEWRRRRRLPG
ncbi:MAG: SCO family protein [Betaproteobacteria bacterium]|nr:SCO family protein [Betaproteobacteria bacterium]